MTTILIVDDEPSIRTLVRASLEPAGHTVLEAADGPASLDLARRRRPDLILLDVALPHMGGLEVCRRLRADPATAATPVLLLSGLHSEPAARVGAQGWLKKPFTPARLLEQVGTTLPA